MTAKDDLNKRLYVYALKIIKFVESIPYRPTTRVLTGQLVRSGTSVTANIFEAKSASSRKDYINFYNHALKSANETKLWLCLLRDSGATKTEVVRPLLKETVEIAKILGASIVTMKSKLKS